MDVVPDKNLEEFLESLEEKPTELPSLEEYLENREKPTETPAEDAWLNIQDALNDWTKRIVDTEARLKKSQCYQQTIEDSLNRQLRDGLLSHHDFSELECIGKLYTNLLNTAACYSVGCGFGKKDLISILLELYTLKQITSTLFIEAVLKL